MAATELAVIGAGPAGVAAATAAADRGVKVTLIDELPAPGGQYLADHPAPAARPPIAATERRGLELLRRLAGSPVERRAETVVWNLAADLTLALYRRGEIEQLAAQAVVIATGARELVVPFPGWTLPGVITVGAGQLLARRHGVLPGRRVLLAGSGPLLLPAACKLAELGAEVVRILEVTRPAAWIRHTPAIWRNWDRLAEGAHYLRELRRARIPYRFGWTPIRALGSDRLEAVVVARLDGHGCPIPGSEETIPADTLCIGFGFAPNIELAQLAGCRLRFGPARGGWTPQLDNTMQTTVPGLFVAGETAGVAGAGAALIEGRIAGLAAACRLGRLAEADLALEMAALQGGLRPIQRFGAMLNTLFAAPAGLSTITTDDTLICRCEEVTAGEVRAAVAQGIVTLDALKTWTRVGQGPCQGRTCGPVLARLIATWTSRASADAGLFAVRPPVKPVPIASLAQGSGGRNQESEDRSQESEDRSQESGVRSQESGGRGQQSAVSSIQLPASSQRADVVVIGGGIVGAACACYLSATGLAVRVLERDFPASGTSRACDGLILLSDKSSAAELALAQASAALWGELAGSLEMDFEYARRGTLVLAETEAGLAAARATAAAMQAAGVRAEVVDNAGLRSLEPALAPDLAGGVFYGDEAQVDARLATVALLMAAQRQGAQLQGNAEVTAIRRGSDGRVAGVVTASGEITTGAVVCAAGVWSNQVAALVGLELPVRPRKGHILVTSRAPGLIAHPLLEGSYAASVHTAAEEVQVALVAEMTAGGTLLLGSSREFAGFDRSVSLPVMQAIAARAVRFLPDLACASIIRSYAGLRPWSPDHLPLVGPVNAVPGFYLATGHEGAGIGLAPITGRIIADWIVNGQAPALAGPISPGRFRNEN